MNKKESDTLEQYFKKIRNGLDSLGVTINLVLDFINKSKKKNNSLS